MKTQLFALGALFTATTHAAIVQYDFDGSLPQGLPNPAGGLIYPINTGFHGTFEYDTTTPANGGGGFTANYLLMDFSLTFDPGGAAATVFFPQGQISVTDAPLGDDIFEIRGGFGLPPSTTVVNGVPLNFFEIDLTFTDPSRSVFSNLDLPGDNLTAADFPGGGVALFDYQDLGLNNANEEGNLDNLNGTTIPEPSGVLLLFGSLGFGTLLRRRK